MTTLIQLQNTINDLEGFARNRGLSSIAICVEFRVQAEPSIFYSWYDPITAENTSAWVYNDNPFAGLAEVETLIKTLPSKEDRERNQYLKHLARAVEYGKKVGIDDDFINPLVLQMKRLSENVIEHHPQRDLDDEIPF